jgi:hypothetical protein
MDEKHSEAWEISLAFLQSHRKVATDGARLLGARTTANTHH